MYRHKRVAPSARPSARTKVNPILAPPCRQRREYTFFSSPGHGAQDRLLRTVWDTQFSRPQMPSRRTSRGASSTCWQGTVSSAGEREQSTGRLEDLHSALPLPAYGFMRVLSTSASRALGGGHLYLHLCLASGSFIVRSPADISSSKKTPARAPAERACTWAHSAVLRGLGGGVSRRGTQPACMARPSSVKPFRRWR